MSISDIVNIGFAILFLIAGFLSIYYQGNSKLTKAVSGFIAEAEATYTSAASGGVKMQYAVGKLYSLLPAVVRPFIPESVIQVIAQSVFDQIAAYAKIQLDRAVDKALPAAVSIPAQDAVPKP